MITKERRCKQQWSKYQNYMNDNNFSLIRNEIQKLVYTVKLDCFERYEIEKSS